MFIIKTEIWNELKFFWTHSSLGKNQNTAINVFSKTKSIMRKNVVSFVFENIKLFWIIFSDTLFEFTLK